MARKKTPAKNALADPWHYPRPDLARHFLDRFTRANSSRGSYFFAPRRKGKTQFLLLDLAPAAVKRRYIVVYSSMWDDLNRPHLALLNSFRDALAAKKRGRGVLAGGFANALRGVKAKAAFKGIEVSADLEFAKNPIDPTSAELKEIEDLIKTLAGRDKQHSLLLMIDEIQHLASRPEFEVLASKIKTLSDKVGSMDLIMTGSSRTGMSELFQENKPLYNISFPEEFSDLDDGFVTHLVKAYGFITNGRKVNETALLRLFKSVDRSPFYLRGVIEAMILQPTLSIDEANERMMDAVSMTGRYEERWNDLKLIDQLVLMKAIDGEPLYTEEALGEFTNQVKAQKRRPKEVSRGLVQSTVRRLTDMHYMTARAGTRGKYDIELMGFREWVKEKTK